MNVEHSISNSKFFVCPVPLSIHYHKVKTVSRSHIKYITQLSLGDLSATEISFLPQEIMYTVTNLLKFQIACLTNCKTFSVNLNDTVDDNIRIHFEDVSKFIDEIVSNDGSGATYYFYLYDFTSKTVTQS